MLLTLALLASQGSLTVDAGRGPITVHLPAGYDPATPAPLILSLHGYSGSAAIQESYFQYLGLQDTYGFVYCTPNGTIDTAGNRFWNATDACCDFNSTGTDDSGYLRTLIEMIESAAAIDPRSIHIIGHSNGGFMAYRMACDHADKLASIISLAGATFDDPMSCGATEPVHVLQVHGTNDQTIRYFGGALFGNAYPSARESAEFWAGRAGCSLTPEIITNALDLDSSIAGPETTIRRFATDCSIGGSAEMWTIPGGGHVPPITDDFRHLTIQFMLSHPKPGVDATAICSPANTHSGGVPAHASALGSDVIVDDALTIRAESLPAGAVGYFLTSQDVGSFDPPGSQGTICLGGTIGRFSNTVLTADANDAFELTVELGMLPGYPPGTATAGQTWVFQAWFRDANPTPTSNLSDAVEVRLR